MDHRTELFEFLVKLIDIQVKKYVSLAGIGVGPDARLNARLVYNEVDELLGFADQLLTDMKSKSSDNAVFLSVFNQVNFYIMEEFRRAKAGWLMDENNIHNPMMDRVMNQLSQLDEIAASANIGSFRKIQAVTDVQRQCEFDSHAIAFKVLDLAKQISENPDMELGDAVPQHAKKILRFNATTRYRNPDIAEQIAACHQSSKNFMSQSTLTKSSSLLLVDEAKEQAEIHKAKWTSISNEYKVINPNSKLFSAEQEWYRVGKAVDKPSNNYAFYSGLAAVAALGVYMLLSYFNQTMNESVHHFSPPQ